MSEAQPRRLSAILLLLVAISGFGALAGWCRFENVPPSEQLVLFGVAVVSILPIGVIIWLCRDVRADQLILQVAATCWAWLLTWRFGMEHLIGGLGAFWIVVATVTTFLIKLLPAPWPIWWLRLTRAVAWNSLLANVILLPLAFLCLALGLLKFRV